MAVQPNAVVEAFSITHAQILDGATDFLSAALATGPVPEDLDIYGVNNASLDASADTYENEGDDTVKSRWNWINNAEVDMQAGYLSFPLIARLTGQTIYSSGTGLDRVFGLDLWHEDSMNVSDVPAILRMPSKDKRGQIRTLTLGIYRLNLKPITFDGPEYKGGLKVNLGGTALFSEYDEKGVLFPDGKRRIARMLSHR